MGMAASQARLLSITSRMSDNELRAQLINNAKMRLTTDSAKVSDEYIAALNQTQLMFSNYDTAGNELYQNLTFNSLTAYSSYNDQYGLVNTGGELLVSATDAANFEKSNNLEEFLEAYGLSKDTTYFETNKLDNVGYYDDYGVWQDLGVSMSDMQIIYEGGIDANGIEHLGVDKVENSEDYHTYATLVDDYNSKKDIYESLITEDMKAYLDGEDVFKNNNTLTVNNKTFDELYKELQNALKDGSAGAAESPIPDNYAGYLMNLLGQLISDGTLPTGSKFEGTLEELENGATVEVGSLTYSYSFQEDGKCYGIAEEDSSGNLTLINPTKVGLSDLASINGVSGKKISIDGETKYLYDPFPSTTSSDLTPYFIYKLDANKSYVDAYKDADGNLTKVSNGNERVEYTDASGNSYPAIERTESVTTQESKADSVKAMYEYFKENVLANLNDEPFRKNSTEEVTDAYNEYIKAAEELAKFIYGDNWTQIDLDTYADYLGDPSWVLSQNHTDTGGGAIIDKSHYNPYTYETTEEYLPVKDKFLIDCMLEHYGEPNYTWIDENDPNENAEAKAQWYTNLYNRMSEGYETINTNLANSSEWLQFALESGLIHMEQVDKSNNWVSMMYNNCSNITESTVDVDITVAEAKYQREMNKIEAKDKQYDIELKNIDTEHNSLQTEYDSIKSVIDKNVERNFKMFQA